MVCILGMMNEKQYTVRLLRAQESSDRGEKIQSEHLKRREKKGSPKFFYLRRPHAHRPQAASLLFGNSDPKPSKTQQRQQQSW
ncbi:unnamed protein product [Coffea canephora]|uniref:Uncharacterized protein n=1 Tax=Coffea canephora TaxID=49390 RepID=A0A068UDY2_COFCA|nr:unnamed protein product [Coffea canephora]